MAFKRPRPNAIEGPIHPKAKPVILTDEEYDDWMRPMDELKAQSLCDFLDGLIIRSNRRENSF
jgi:hypothetical protein